MIADKLCEKIREKKNPCIVGLDPEWEKLPECYKTFGMSPPEAVLRWAFDIIDTVSPLVCAVKPQMAFYEVYGNKGIDVFEKIGKYAHEKGLLVIDDSKRGDIGNTAKAYAFAHLAKRGPINADFLTVSPFLGTDSIRPFLKICKQDDKGIFLLVKTSNPSSVEISQAVNTEGKKISLWLSEYINDEGRAFTGECGYSSLGAVVGATFPGEASELRQVMRNSFFLVPGYGAQGGKARDIVRFFNEDGLGALISSSRDIIYKHSTFEGYDGSRNMYLDIVRSQAEKMQKDVYQALQEKSKKLSY